MGWIGDVCGMNEVNKVSNDLERKAASVSTWVIDKALSGLGPVKSAKELAAEYEADRGYGTVDERIEALVRWESGKNFTSGFVTGLGGAATLPVTIPAAFSVSWLIQARMAATVAILAGYDADDDRVKTFILMCLLGDGGEKILKEAGIAMDGNGVKTVIGRLPERVLEELGKKVGVRLLAKTGERGVVNLLRMVPVASGLVGGVMDASFCRVVGNRAIELFPR